MSMHLCFYLSIYLLVCVCVRVYSVCVCVPVCIVYVCVFMVYI